ELQGQLVHLALRMRAGESFGDLFWPLAAGEALADLLLEQCRILGWRRLRPRDDDDHFAADVGREMLRELREGAARQLFVDLGQLPRDQRRPVAQRGAQLEQRVAQSLRRFIEDELR